MAIKRYECENCRTQFAEIEDLINPIPDLEERVLPGEPMPFGACPECGAVVHPIGKPDPPDPLD